MQGSLTSGSFTGYQEHIVVQLMVVGSLESSGGTARAYWLG